MPCDFSWLGWQAEVLAQPQAARNYQQVATALALGGKSAAAVRAYGRAIALDPTDPHPYLLLAAWQREHQDWPGAIATAQAAIVQGIDDQDLWLGLAESYRALARPRPAIAIYHRLLDRDPTHFALYRSLGAAYQAAGDLAAARQALGRYAGHDPTCAVTQLEIGDLWADERCFAEAIAAYDHALAIDPGNLAATYRSSFALLTLGHWAIGFQRYEARWATGRTFHRFSQPVWDGRAELRGQTILIWGEQGYGDALQLVRYFEWLVAEKGARVVFCGLAGLVRLFTAQPAIAAAVAFGEPIPDFDCHLPLGSLPLVHGTTLETVPARVPYLQVPAGRKEEGGKRKEEELVGEFTGARSFLLPGCNVGLVWASGYHATHPEFYAQKTPPFESLLGAILRPQIKLWSLQVGHDADRLRASGDWPPELVDLSPQIRDFADTAAIVAQLDLVISVDTGVAHLAGALGRPVWILLPWDADWRWLDNCDDSPWYPTARLFRQPRAGDWVGAIAQVGRALEGWLGDRGGEDLGRSPPEVAAL